METSRRSFLSGLLAAVAAPVLEVMRPLAWAELQRRLPFVPCDPDRYDLPKFVLMNTQIVLDPRPLPEEFQWLLKGRSDA